MSNVKNALIRYIALDKCFRNPGKKYGINELIEACNYALEEYDPGTSGICRRQVYYDIQFMMDSLGYQAPIEKYPEGRNVYYRYSDRNYSISNQPLNEQEALQLKESLITLSRFKGMPQFDWVEELTVRLQQTFNFKTDEKVLSFEENIDLVGLEHISKLYNAIINRTVLQITYKSYKSEEESNHIIHPYHLKQYNNRWFLFGLNAAYKNISNLALDRIKNIKELKTDFIDNKEIDFDEFFYDVVGVSVDLSKAPQKVILKVDPDLLPYVISKPLHGSQKKPEIIDGETFINIKVQLNYELESLILSFGEKLEVVEPIELRLKIAERIKRNSINYNI